MLKLKARNVEFEILKMATGHLLRRGVRWHSGRAGRPWGAKEKVE